MSENFSQKTFNIFINFLIFIRKKIMRKIFLFLLVFLSLSGCGLFKKTHKTTTQENPYDIIYSRTIDNMTLAQFDSVCVADTLLGELDDWYTSYFVDEETKETIAKHIYIKQNKRFRTIYVFTVYTDEKKYKMTIRTEEDND